MAMYLADESFEGAGIDRFLRIKEVERVVGFKKSKIWDLVAKQDFPAPHRLRSLSITVWRESAIKAWMDSQM